MPERSEAQVGIVLSEQNAVLGARGEHPVRFVDALRHQIVDQHADVGFVALQNDRRLPYPFAMRVDPCQQALRRSLLVTCRAVDLAGEIESVDEFRFERMAQLGGREVVVFDRIAGPEDMDVLQPPDPVQRLVLYLPRQRRREAVEIVFIGVISFWFKE